MLRWPLFFIVAVPAALFITSCATDTPPENIPEPPIADRYRGLSGEGKEEPWQGGAERFEVRPTDVKTGVATEDRSSPGDEVGENERRWRGRFVLKELMAVVDPETVDLRQVYMCADPRIYNSQMEPSLKGGITRTRVAVRSENKDSGWLILIDQEPTYRMYQVITRDEIVRTLSWAGAEHILLGTVSFAGVTFDSDPSFPLHFKLVQEVGYVHLCGRGTVTTRDGRKHSLEQVQEVSDFVKDLGAEDQLVREAASEALGWLAKTNSEMDEAVPALVVALQDNAMEVRRNAAGALGRIGDARAREGLKAALEDEDEWVREVVADALKKLGE